MARISPQLRNGHRRGARVLACRVAIRGDIAGAGSQPVLLAIPVPPACAGLRRR